MKMLLTGAAFAFLATAATAQTVTPMDNPAAAPAAPAMTPADPATPAAPQTSAEAPAGTMLVERDGKWWNGDKPATKSEIAAYKKARKAGSPG